MAASPELFRSSTFAIVEGGETLGMAYFSVERSSCGTGFDVVQCDLDAAGKVWNATPTFHYDDFQVACGRASREAAQHSVFVSH